MLTLDKYQKIPKDVSTKNDLDFAWLKKVGIEYIESIGGTFWSDFNAHDPGITMLEVLCYAITDLGARIDLPIQDLLTGETGFNLNEQFYRASDIMTTSPVTQLDYRKMFIDIPGVRNCWMEPYQQTIHVNCHNNELSYDLSEFDGIKEQHLTSFNVKGLNRLLVDYDLEEVDEDGNPVTIESIDAEIMKRYHAHRNLCEDLVEIKPIEEQRIAVCVDIELEKTVDENLVHAQVITSIENYFTAEIKRYSLKDMQEKGYRTDEIFEGPFMENGFIDSQELIDAELRTEVRLSDIVNLIMKIDGVKIIHKITIQRCGDQSESEWLMCVKPGHKPVMAPTVELGDEDDECDLRSVFNYKKDVLPISYSQDEVDSILEAMKSSELQLGELIKKDVRLKVESGTYRDVGATSTIQNDFPDTYGIGPAGLPATATGARKAQAKQLKGYLLFFDQIFASYFAHLNNVRSLFAINEGEDAPTYFTQAVEGIKGFDELVTDYPSDNTELTETLIEFLDKKIKRRNELLDHLLARFAERFTEYSFLMMELFGKASQELLIQSKEQFLQRYVEISKKRSDGYNYTLVDDVWDTENVSGAQMRIASLTGMRNFIRRDISQSNVNFDAGIDGDGPFSWEITNEDLDPILVSNGSDPTLAQIADEMYRAVYLILNTPQSLIESKLSGPITNGMMIGQIQILESGSDYIFRVLDPKITNSSNQVIALGPVAYSDVTVMKTAILDLVEFLKFKFNEEGIYLVEHLLLRPDIDDENVNKEAFLPICADDCNSDCGIDPYSFRVSVILPGFTQRFGDMDFRRYMDKLIREELPSHVLPRICWIGYRENTVDPERNELMNFESAYKEFLMNKSEDKDTDDKLDILKNLNERISNLHNIYDAGKLHDCEDNSYNGKIILGRTNLGTN